MIKTATTPNERTRARLLHAIARRLALIAVLSPSGACAICEVVHHASDLEIDHIDGRSWNPRAMSPQMRAARYWREHNAGVRLRALCRGCNARDGNRRRWSWR